MGPKSDHCFALSLRQSVGIFRLLLVMMSNQTELKFAHELLVHGFVKIITCIVKVVTCFSCLLPNPSKLKFDQDFEVC